MIGFMARGGHVAGAYATFAQNTKLHGTVMIMIKDHTCYSFIQAEDYLFLTNKIVTSVIYYE